MALARLKPFGTCPKAPSYKHFMLNSQQRSATQKNIPSHREPMQIFFCVAAVPLPTLLNSGVSSDGRDDIFLCCLTPFSQQQSLRQHGSFAIVFIFFG
jgi:hypothetical protein